MLFALQSINTVLMGLVINEPERFKQILINPDSLDLNSGQKEFTKQLLSQYSDRLKKLNRKPDLADTQFEDQFMQKINKYEEVLINYETDEFSILPLKKPDEVACYYFRNKSGLFLGELKPYLSLLDINDNIYKYKYWEGWQEKIDNFHIIDVNSSNHHLMLIEQKPVKTILEFCQEIYSGKGKTADILNVFKNKQVEDVIKN